MLAGINRPTMKTISLLFVVLLVSVSCLAQVKPKFASQQLVGLLEGEGGSAFQIQTINGVQLKKWFMGLGTGIDWYEYRSIPVFLSLNYDLKMSNRRFFLSADAGKISRGLKHRVMDSELCSNQILIEDFIQIPE